MTSIDTEQERDTHAENEETPVREAVEIPADVPVTVIRPTHGWRALDLRELWRFRELAFILTWRQISIRYKQTFLGAGWAIIQPLMTTGIFSALFGLLMGRGNEPSVGEIPYVVSTFCAMLPWQLFASSLNQSGNSLVQNRAMIQKIYFPRLILPLSSTLACLVDFAIAFVALILMMLYYGIVPTWAIITLPVFIFMAVTASLAVSLWLSAMAAIYRDFKYVLPFIVQIGMFVSPVVYSMESIRHKLPDWAVTLYGLNPMAGVIEGFRWAILGTASPPSVHLLAASTAATLAILVGGAFYFRRMERLFADVI
ncbi:ABC transporter permease [Thermostilla marina]